MNTIIEIEKVILSVLEKMQEVAPTYLTGGYLRDKLIGMPPNDVDILTNMSIEQVKELFPMLQGTETGLEFGVGRFSKGGFQFEITCREDKTIEELIKEKDYVLNSLYHDGNTLVDLYGACEDIQQKVIRALQDPKEHAKEHPQAYLRAIRLSAQLGFNLEDKLFTFLQEHKHIFYDNNESRIQQEGYRMMRAAYPLYAFELLAQLGFVTELKLNATKPWQKHVTLPPLEDKLYLRLLLLSQYTGIQYIHHFIEVFHLTKHLKEQMHYLMPYVDSDNIPTHPRTLHKVILLKRIQYENEPEKFKAFLEKVKASKEH